MEGIFFYAGFAMMLSLLRQRKMIGVGEQFQYILRDETVHLAAGIALLHGNRGLNALSQTLVENFYDESQRRN
jgi:ribonucleotide reductase beta subunit family protein with ferritin-like domain